MYPATVTPTGTVTPNGTVTPKGAGAGAGTGFDVVPAALTGAAGTIDAEAAALDEATAALARRLADLGPCWGDDIVGQRFATGYGPAAQVVVGNLGALSVGLVRIAAALRAVAATYEHVDTSIATTAADAAAVPRAIDARVPVSIASITPLMTLVSRWRDASRSLAGGNAAPVTTSASIAGTGGGP